MAYLIDTDILLDFLDDDPVAVQLWNQLREAGIAIGMITYMEAFQGTLRSVDPVAAAREFETILANVDVLPFSAAEARRCARLREDLRRQSKRVRSRALDLIIAATALEHDLILVTRNTADYRDLPELRLY